MRSLRSRGLVLGAAALGAVALAACGAGKDKGGSSTGSTSGGAITIGTTDVVTALDPAGSYDNVLETKEFSCIESGSDHKFYAPGTGLIRELAVSAGRENISLVSVTH